LEELVIELLFLKRLFKNSLVWQLRATNEATPHDTAIESGFGKLVVFSFVDDLCTVPELI